MSRRPQVAVIGGRDASERAIREAEALGAALVEAGCRVVCGGRDGIMAAVCRGARNSPGWFEGATVGVLPTDTAMGANAWVDVVVPTGLGIARNVVVVRSGDVVVAVAGRAGTLSELALAWDLGKPICALDLDEGWASRAAGWALDDRPRPPIHRATDLAEVLRWVHANIDDTPAAPTDEAV
jgi:uncharacterized protein (TIGR00725 family)